MIADDHRERLEPLDRFFHRRLHPLQSLFYLNNINIIVSLAANLHWGPKKRLESIYILPIILNILIPLTIGLKTAAFRSSGQNLCEEIIIRGSV